MKILPIALALAALAASPAQAAVFAGTDTTAGTFDLATGAPVGTAFETVRGDVGTGRFNGDAVDDLYTVDGNKVIVRDGVTHQRLAALTVFEAGTNGFRMAVGDVTCDGTPEVVVSARNVIKVFSGKTMTAQLLPYAPPVFIPGAPASTNYRAYPVAIGDADGDCRGDVFTASNLSVKVFDVASKSALRALTNTALANPGVAAGDFDGDGLADPTVFGKGQVRVFGPSGASLGGVVVSTGPVVPGWPADKPGAPEGVVAATYGDLDGDGREELIAASKGTIKVFDTATGALRSALSPWAPLIPSVSALAVQRGA